MTDAGTPPRRGRGRPKGSKDKVRRCRVRRGGERTQASSAAAKADLLVHRLAASGGVATTLAGVSRVVGVNVVTIRNWMEKVPGLRQRIEALMKAGAERVASGAAPKVEALVAKYPRPVAKDLPSHHDNFFEGWVLTGSREEGCKAAGMTLDEVEDERAKNPAFDREFRRVMRLLRVRAEDAVLREGGTSSSMSREAMKILDGYLGPNGGTPESWTDSASDSALSSKFFGKVN